MLKSLIDFWNNIFIANWKYTFPIIISVFSLIIATRSFNTNRARIKFLKKIFQPYYLVNENQLALVSGDDKSKVLYNFPMGILFHISVLNSSPKDVAFFNLHCEINKSLDEIYTKQSLAYIKGKDNVVIFKRSQDFIGEITIPEEPQGKFEANSLTPLYSFIRLDKYIFNDQLPKKVTFKLSYAMRKWYFPFRIYSTKKIVVKGETFTSWLKEQQELAKKSKKPKKSSANASQTPPYSKKKRRHRK